MTQEKLIYTLRLSPTEQKALRDEMTTLLTSHTIELPISTFAFLQIMVDKLSDSILQCAEMELQYEQAIINEEVECSACLGSGWIDGDPCSHCNGEQIISMIEAGVI